jgi:membrane protease YdiL (CAAX protease family)
LRARVVVSAVGAVLAYYGLIAVIAIGIGAVQPNAWNDGRLGVAAATLPVLVAALLVNGAFVARGWSSMRQVRWPSARPAAAALVGGFGIGLAMAALALALAVVGGGARLLLTGEPVGAYVGAAAALALGLAVAALAEELLFRGFPLARLAEPLGRVGASVLLAFAFAAVHLANPDVSTLGLANIVLASLVLSAAFFTPGGLPLAWGVHWGWNGGLALGADAPVSGLTFDVPALEFYTGRTPWLTGGAFGPEGGLAASGAMALALIWLGRRAAAVGKGEPT